MGFAAVEDAVASFGRGEIVIVVDDEARENEGDLVMAADHATPEKIAFFLKHTSGFICAPMSPGRLDDLGIPLMVSDNRDAWRTAFAVSVDARVGTSTGISASDRAATVRSLADPSSAPDDFNRPGHVLPLRAAEGGVLKRAGHTEATVDLARAAGVQPVGVLCEVVSEDKTQMARLPELERLAERHNMPLISIAQLIRYRHRVEQLVHRSASTRLPLPGLGDFTCHAYTSVFGEEHFALVKGDIAGRENVLVRVHSECLTGDVFGSLRCDCGQQVKAALEMIHEEGAGVIVYLRGHEGRGIGLTHKLRAYGLQELGRDTIDANLDLDLPIDSREYGIGAQILVDLGVSTMRCMTNNPAKYGGLAGFGLTMVERVPLEVYPNAENLKYLQTKKHRMGHVLDLVADRIA